MVCLVNTSGFGVRWVYVLATFLLTGVSGRYTVSGRRRLRRWTVQLWRGVGADEHHDQLLCFTSDARRTCSRP